MTSPNTMQAIDVLDWHDGAVMALVHVPWTDGVHLASLISWDMARGIRLYCFVPLTMDDATVIRAECDRGDRPHVDWERIAGEWRQRFVSREVVLAACDSEDRFISKEKSLPASRIAQELFESAEAALGAERLRWFDEVELRE